MEYSNKAKTGLPETWTASLILLVFLVMVAALLPPRALALDITVREVAVEGLHSIEKEELLYLLDISPGGTINAISVRMGIKRAFLKGIFEDIQVAADGEGDVRVTVEERDIIEKIKIKGNERISGRFLKKSLGFQEGEIMRYDLLEEKQRQLLTILAQKGFPSAEADIRVLPADDADRVEVVVEVAEGPPLEIDRIVILGRPLSEVSRMMKVHSGDIYDQMKLGEDLERIEEKYREKGYLNPVVGPYTYKDGVLRLRVEVGRKLKVNIVGNDSIRGKYLKEVMPFFEAREIRDDLVNEAIDRMLSLYYENGFPSAQIAPVVTGEDDVIVVNFYVFEGQKVLVESIHISGTDIPEDGIREIIALKRMHAYNPERLDADIRRIREFHVALGYLDAEVKPPRVNIYESWARIEIEVVPGRKVNIKDIVFKGASQVSERRLFNVVDIKPGDPYNEVDISAARRRIVTTYKSSGYFEVEVEVSRDFTPGGAVVVFNIREGEKLFFGKTVVTGNRDIRSVVITRELRYQEGKPFNPSLLTETRQRLFRLGLFASVNFRTLERVGDTVDIELEVREAKAGAVEFGFGYGDYEGYRGFLDISYRNLFGMNRQISLRTEVNSLGNKVSLTYREPYLFGRKIESRSFLLREDRKEKNIDTGETSYRIKRNTASTGVEKDIGNNFKASLFYEFSVVETTDVKPGVVLSHEDTGTLAISSLSPGIVYDTRDDPFDPQSGIFSGVTVKTASYLLVSETDFVKTTARFSTYHRLARWLVAALSFRGGSATGLRDTRELPLVERFFLGGRNTVRGFDQDSIGPKSAEGTPIGGNAFVLANLELRTRVYGGFRVVPFVDMGNVWLRNSDVDLDELRYTAGVGFQYHTPVGPFRLDFGYKLDREEGESPSELHFSLGHAF